MNYFGIKNQDNAKYKANFLTVRFNRQNYISISVSKTNKIG